MSSYRRRFARKIPDSGSNDDEYKMNTSRTFETERIREHMKISLDFINYLIENGWVAEDSEVIDNMSKVWLDIWNEYVSVREAVEGQKVKEDLFGGGNPYFSPGAMIDDIRKLGPGDAIDMSHLRNTNFAALWIVIRKDSDGLHMQTKEQFVSWYNNTGAPQPFTSESLAKCYKKWTYLGTNIWKR